MREQVVRFGNNRSLVGILTNPHEAVQGQPLPAIILLNAGIVHHVGPHRLSVKVARHLATLGYVVLRFDFSGIGDSQAREDHLPFAQSAISETQEAMDYVQAVRGTKHFVLAGLCSGADAVFQTACRDVRVMGAVLLNAQGYQLEDNGVIPYIEQREDRRHYWQVAFRHPTRLLEVFKGKKDYRRILHVLSGQLKGKSICRRELATGAHRVAADMHSLLDRGVNMLLIYSAGETSLEYLRMMLHEVRPAWQTNKRWRLEVMEQTDHLFTPLSARTQLLNLLSDWLRLCHKVDSNSLLSTISSIFLAQAFLYMV